MGRMSITEGPSRRRLLAWLVTGLVIGLLAGFVAGLTRPRPSAEPPS